MGAVTICSDFGAQENKISHCFHCFPICLSWSDGTRCHDLRGFFFWYWVLSRLFHSPPSPSSRGSLVPLRFSAIRVASFTYLRLFMFLPTVLIPACISSSPAFHMMCSVYKLNKYGDNKQPCRTPFSILNQSFVPFGVLTIASWPAYKFLRRQVRWSGIPIF